MYDVKKVAAAVDRLGELKAAKAALDKRIKAEIAVLVKAGVGNYEGDLFRASVAVSVSSKLDMAKVRAKLSEQFIRANSYPVEKVDVKVVARNNINVKEAA
jgi:hypothetical protein